MKPKEQLRAEAQARAEARAKRTVGEQMALIAQRPGESAKERVKLSGPPKNDRELAQMRRKARALGFKSSEIKRMSPDELQRVLLAGRT